MGGENSINLQIIRSGSGEIQYAEVGGVIYVYWISVMSFVRRCGMGSSLLSEVNSIAKNSCKPGLAIVCFGDRASESLFESNEWKRFRGTHWFYYNCSEESVEGWIDVLVRETNIDIDEYGL